MFDSIGWPEILVLVVAGLFILGPERLPDAARWLGKTIGQVKNFTTGAQSRIRSELGSDFDELAQPLNDLQRLRGRDPRRAAFDALMRDDTPAATAGRPAPQPAADAPRSARREPGAAPVDYDAT